MKTQWQKEIEKLHTMEMNKLQAIRNLEQHDIDISARDLRMFKFIAYGAIACALLLSFI